MSRFLLNMYLSITLWQLITALHKYMLNVVYDYGVQVCPNSDTMISFENQAQWYHFQFCLSIRKEIKANKLVSTISGVLCIREHSISYFGISCVRLHHEFSLFQFILQWYPLFWACTLIDSHFSTESWTQSRYKAQDIIDPRIRTIDGLRMQCTKSEKQ